MKGTKKPRLPAAAPGTGRRNSHVGSTTSPDPEATNGIPPNSSGFQSGMWPVCFHHSALQAWNENPALYWSLQGLASQRPASIGSDRITGHSANAALASSAGRRGPEAGLPAPSRGGRAPATGAAGGGGWRGGGAWPGGRRGRAGRGHTSPVIVRTAARPAAARRRGGAPPGATAATTATPVPSDIAWSTKADAAAGPASTPACRARTTRPATLHTFPGT